MLREPHAAPLTDLVHAIRQERGLSEEVPYFDPLDGGVEARVLFVLEAPGPKAVASGFVSRNNPDETAKNTFLFLKAAGIPRRLTLLWNIVPWYIGSRQKIRPATFTDLEEGRQYLLRLLKRLPKLEVVVLVGRKAERTEQWLKVRCDPQIRLLRAPHPSPLFVNRSPVNRKMVEDAMRKVASALGM